MTVAAFLLYNGGVMRTAKVKAPFNEPLFNYGTLLAEN
jgi:hypothetical protein